MQTIGPVEYGFTLTGVMPILIHADDVMASDALTVWRSHPDNKNVSKAGDDRSPAWTWQTYLYCDGTHLAMPQECLMTSLRKAATQISIPDKKQKTFKELSQSGIVMLSDFLEFRNDGKQIAIKDVLKFRNLTFSEHVKHARDLGFDLMIKRAKVGQSKHVRVRAVFAHWTVSGRLAVNEPVITHGILEQMFYLSGRYAGLGDWRPSAPKSPGPYGTFTADVLPAKAARKAG